MHDPLKWCSISYPAFSAELRHRCSQAGVRSSLLRASFWSRQGEAHAARRLLLVLTVIFGTKTFKSFHEKTGLCQARFCFGFVFVLVLLFLV